MRCVSILMFLEDKRMHVVLTYDLKSGSDYSKASKLLEAHGLHEFSPNKSLKLPNTTVMGDISHPVSAAELRDYFWKLFEDNDLQPTRLMGGCLEDWATKTHPRRK